MTAEVAVLNRSAVAVAADSAVTRGRNKVHVSANKIFQLHKQMPIGILVYNYADIFGLPWELVIKSFREHIHDTTFTTLRDVCDRFVEFIQGPSFLTDEARALDTLLLAMNHFDQMASGLSNQGKRNFNRLFADNLQAFASTPADDLDAGQQGFSLVKFRREFGNLCRMVCGESNPYPPLSHANNVRFIESLYRMVTSELASDYHSGFAIFGYGSTELLPSIAHYVVDGAPLGKLRILRNQFSSITRTPDANALVFAFAQQDAATLFMEGISPSLRRYFVEAMNRSLTGFSRKIHDEMRDRYRDPNEATVSRAIFDREINVFIKKFNETIDSLVHKQHVSPIVSSVDGLAKEDMASLAESMVELASLRKKVSPDIETVGGPIDVAVVSKADGFVWIKRKYYFDYALNRGFYQNYFKQRFDLDGRS